MLLAITVSSFAQYKHSVQQAQARLLESQFSLLTAPIIGEVGEISAVKIVDSMEFFIGTIKDAKTEIVPYLDDYKRYVIAHYCSRHSYDLILNPLFQISTNADGDKLKVIVTGFPAKYKSFRPATENDKWMMLYFMSGMTTDDRINEILNKIK